MSQNCPNCGTPVPAGQRFCNNCGTPIEAVGPASQYGGPPPQSFPQPQPQQPPFAQSPYPRPQLGQQPQYGQLPQYQQNQQPQKNSPIGEALGALGLLFLLRRYRPGYRARRQSSGCCGCLVTLVILLIVLGIPAYAVYRANPHLLQQIQQNFNNANHSNNSNNGTIVNTGSNGTVPNTQPQITTAQINQSVTYAGVDTTIVSVQQSTAFIDDRSTAANGMIRVNIKEANNSSSDTSYFYSDMTHLILPDKSRVAPVNESQAVGPAKTITRDNWIDFAVPTSIKINQLTLLLGTTQDAQISIPLTGNANLSAFQTKTVNQNIPINYEGLNWTLKTATSSLSIGGKQASTGMRYVVLSFNVDNHTTGGVVIGFTDEYMRLQSGANTNPALDTTLPTTINANTTGITGTVTFLMPANDTAFTLIFLARQSLGITQATTDFKIL
jgi:hypothetical protein